MAVLFTIFINLVCNKLLNILAPLYKRPHQKTIAKRLRKQYYQCKKDLRAKLKSVTHIVLATDLWKNKVGSYWL